ncbi:MAG TPA: hypothetical protein VEQ60_30165 [Longimicrobium sp.]|nr:hypothetical protein [Longimicrobium sp.]
MPKSHVVVRYLVALTLFVYGFAKLNGTQFTVLDSELDRPMGEVSGFWLTWYYFGYSRAYGTLLALAQVGGAALLLFRRTTLLGALFLLPVVGNIVLINVFYGIARGALIVSVLLLAGLAVLLHPHWDALVEVLWTRQRGAAAPARGWRVRGAKAAVCTAMVAFAFGLTWWTANYNNVVLTPLDGAWNVAQASGAVPAGKTPRAVYFERNRPYMAVFRYAERSETHHFEVDPRRRTVSVFRDWLRKGPRVFEGSYTLRGDQLRLSGRFAGQDGPATLLLARRRVAGR